MFEHEYRDMAFVPRWAILRTIKNQSVAEHSYFVALYSEQICSTLGLTMEQTGCVLSYALLHDVAETFLGDIPGPSKREIVDKAKYEKFESCTVADKCAQRPRQLARKTNGHSHDLAAHS